MSGSFLSNEEYDAASSVDRARRAEVAGYGASWVSEHVHPWNDEHRS